MGRWPRRDGELRSYGSIDQDTVYFPVEYVYETAMRTKLTVTIDEELLPKAKRHARSQKMSLSWLIESALRGLTAEDRPSFSRRWRGRFRPAGRKDKRYAALAKKYL